MFHPDFKHLLLEYVFVLKKQQLLRLVPFATATSIAKALNSQGNPRDPERTCVNDIEYLNDMGSLEMFRGHKWIWYDLIMLNLSLWEQTAFVCKVRRFAVSQACRLRMVLGSGTSPRHLQTTYVTTLTRYPSSLRFRMLRVQVKPGRRFNLRTVNGFAGLDNIQHWLSRGITIWVLALGVQLPKNRWLLSPSLQGT